jgi:hypothetical protein
MAQSARAGELEQCGPEGRHDDGRIWLHRRRLALPTRDHDHRQSRRSLHASCKLVQVTVFYRPVTGHGQVDQERRIDVITMLVARS